MTDETMKDLVNEHDKIIKQLINNNMELTNNVKALVAAQTEMAKQLKSISESLTKQMFISERLENMDKEIRDSFSLRDKNILEGQKRVFDRIAVMEKIQQSDIGCNSVRLLTKDVDNLIKEIDRIIKIDEINNNRITVLENHNASIISPATYKWTAAILISYSIMFGVYVVQSINSLSAAYKESSTLLHRDIQDTSNLMKKIYK